MKKHLHSEDRLAILQAADTHRKWYSLDDQRVCVLCDRLITGRQIDITLDKRGQPEAAVPHARMHGDAARLVLSWQCCEGSAGVRAGRLQFSVAAAKGITAVALSSADSGVLLSSSGEAERAQTS
jgi:hypothetical protein